MKIALVSQEYPPDTAHGGIATQTHAKAVGLARLGHEVHVLTRSTDGLRHTHTDATLSVLRLPGSHDWSRFGTDIAQWLAWSVDVAAALAELHGRVGIDVVDVPEYGAEGYVHLLNQTAWSRIPTVVHLHGPVAMLTETIGWPEPNSDLHLVGTHMERTCLRVADAVMSSSECSARWCANTYDLDAATVPIVHTGVDTTLFLPRAPTEETGPPTVVFVGRLAVSKGVDALVEAACVVADDVPDLKVVLIGRGDQSVVQGLIAVAEAAGHPQLLDVRGHLTRDELAQQLPQADVFAAPSRYEGGPGLVYLEAMSCGLPVIACAGSGAAEVVVHGETGLLVSPGDHEGLVAALRLSLTSEGAALGDEGRRRAVEQHDTTLRIAALERIYSDVAAGAPLRRSTT